MLYTCRYFKMKVGSQDPQEDVVRARAIREEIGEDNFLMMDANQKWDVPEAIECMKMLAPYAKCCAQSAPKRLQCVHEATPPSRHRAPHAARRDPVRR